MAPVKRGALAAVLAIALTACYSPSFDRCAIRCDDDVCPGDLQCRADGFCLPAGDDAECVIDPTGDAGPDAAPPAELAVIAAGYGHTCGITTNDARLYCWGSNAQSQLGRERTELRRSGVGIEVDATTNGWSAVAGGDYHTCALRDGTLWCWGDNGVSQCGADFTVDYLAAPEQVPGDDWLAIATGGAHTCGIRGVAGGVRTLVCFGADGDSALGDGTAGGSRPEPMPVADPAGGAVDDWASLAANASQTCAITDGGQLYCWGTSSGGLGVGDTAPRATPTAVTHADVTTWTQVSTGRRSACAIGDGALYCWGDNDNGELGTGGGNSAAPVLVDDDATWTAIAAGGQGACGVADGGLRCWGLSNLGQIGDGRWSSAPTPVAVDLPGVTALAAGASHRCAIAGGVASCWGDNSAGQVGDSRVSIAWDPVQVGESGGWTDVSTGNAHTCGVHNGALVCWGRNENRELGQPGGDRLEPTVIGEGTDWSDVALGYRHGCGVRNPEGVGDEVWCWGTNDSAQLGTGMGPGDFPPAEVSGNRTMNEVTTSTSGSCAIAAGVRYCWGYNESMSYPLGLNDMVDHPIPAMVQSTPSAWDAISQGSLFGCGISAADGALACWGLDADGQQADGEDDNAPEPLPHVVDSGPWELVAAASDGDHACGVKSGGSAWCWGANESNQLAYAGGPGRAPVEVVRPAGEDWTSVAAGASQSCGIAADKLYCWGSNEHGQLGTDGIAFSVTPRQVMTKGVSWRQVSTAATHTCAITTGGDLYCWGYSTRGQIGDGTASHPVPTGVVLE